ncbi:MAG: rhodanese-like domain-containing protein [Chitinophagaceae bacterium]
MTALTAIEAIKTISETENLVIIDTRDNHSFADGFIPGAIFIGLNERFEDWVISLIPSGSAILMVTAAGKEDETTNRLKKAGFDKITGYLAGGMDAWKKAGNITDLLIQVEADELAMDIPFDDHLIVLDVRNETEFADGHVKNAINISLKTMVDPGVMAVLEEKDNLYILSKSGYRSTIAASLLKRQGFHNLRNLLGGWDAVILEKKIETEKEQKALN